MCLNLLILVTWNTPDKTFSVCLKCFNGYFIYYYPWPFVNFSNDFLMWVNFVTFSSQRLNGRLNENKGSSFTY